MEQLHAAETSPIPYRRLGIFYFIYFCELGIFVPFWSLYLSSEGYSAKSIGVIMAAMMATRLIGSNVWGWLGDKIQRPLLVARMGLLFAIVGFSFQFAELSFGLFLMVLCVYSFFWNAILPQIEVYTMRSLGDESHYYGKVRLWGSLGFIVFVLLCGYLFDRIDLGWAPVIMVGVMSCVLLASFALRDSAAKCRVDKVALLPLLNNRKVACFFAVCFLMVVSHGPFYVFYSIYLESHGYSKMVIGILWSVGVSAEILLFTVMHRLIERFGLNNLLIASLLIAAIRWIVVGEFADSLWIMVLAQTFHAATYAVFHGVGIQFIHNEFGLAHAGKGQSLYASIGYGAGSAVGAWYAGHIWNVFGPSAAFYGAAGFNLIAIFICVFALKELR